MKNKGVRTKTILCLLMIMLLAGCRGARELNALSIVVGAGIDKSTEAPDEVLLTAQIVKPSKIKSASGESSSGSSGGSQEKAYWNIQASGETLFDAARETTHETNNKLYFAHNKVIVIGKDLAAAGIQKHLDFFLRLVEPRPTTLLLVSGTTAADVLDVAPQLDILPAINISKLDEAQEFTSQSRPIDMVDYTNAMLSKTSSLVLPIIAVRDSMTGKTAVIQGSAVFKRDRMVGELNENETRGLLWIKGKVKSSVLNIPYREGKVGIEIKNAESSADVELKDGKVTVKVKIKQEGIVVDNETSTDVATVSAFADMEKLESDYITNEIIGTFQKAQNMNTDIYGIGELVHKKYPGEWKKIEDKWDEIFPSVQLELEVTSKLTATGLSSKPAVPE